MPYKGFSKVLYHHPKSVKAIGDNCCYFCSTVYLLTVSQDEHLAFSLCNYVTDETNYNCLGTYILTQYKDGAD